ncbi:MAG: division/cell wall cluster transcriptional repressor MraZ [Actinomycetota bacterium]
MAFTGEFRHAIDAKGRLIVPSRLRDELAEDLRVHLTVSPDGYVAMYSGQGWKELEERLLAQRSNEKEKRAVVGHFFNKAHTDTVDKQGRISVPQQLRDYARIDKDVVITGEGNHAGIWSPQKYEEREALVAAQGLDALFEQLDI